MVKFQLLETKQSFEEGNDNVKKFNSVLTAALVALVSMCGFQASAAQFGPLGADTAAFYGANYMMELRYDDLPSGVATNTAVTFTNLNTRANIDGSTTYSAATIASNSTVEFVWAQLVTPFTSGNTNYTGSTLIAIGDSSSTTQFLGRTEFNVDGTYSPIVRPASGVTIAIQAGALTATNGLVLPAQIVTNVTISSSAPPNSKTYTANSHFVLTVTPNAEESVSGLSNGVLRAYFRIRGKTASNFAPGP